MSHLKTPKVLNSGKKDSCPATTFFLNSESSDKDILLRLSSSIILLDIILIDLMELTNL